MRYLDGTAVAALGPAAAVQAISQALRGGFDPAGDPPRSAVELAEGQFLLMPSQSRTGAGVKVATVAPGNQARGLPRIQAAYLLFDRTTLALRAVLDGTALTTLRTPAVSVAGVLPALPERPLHVVVIGAGPQATGHVATLGAVRQLASVTYVVRDPARTPLDAIALGTPQSDQALQAADVVVCATSARRPVFDSAVLGRTTVVIAVGSHEPGARELDAALLRRATVVVEDITTALREAGDVVLAVAEDAVSPADLVPMRAFVAGDVLAAPDSPVVFKSVGMSWQDLVIAEAVLDRDDAQHTDR